MPLPHPDRPINIKVCSSMVLLYIVSLTSLSITLSIAWNDCEDIAGNQIMERWRVLEQIIGPIPGNPGRKLFRRKREELCLI